MISFKNKAGRIAMVTATGGFMMGMALLSSGSAHAIGGLCNGRPASHTWLDASGQPGPAIVEGTSHDDVIVGSDGDDTIDGNGGSDFICGGPGNDSITAGPGGDSAVRGDTGDDDLTALGTVHSVTLVGDGGNDTLEVDNTVATSYLVGGSDDDVLIHLGGGHLKMDGGNDFDDCLMAGGDEVVNCEY